MTSQDNNQSSTNQGEGNVNLYAGKYKTIEELEKAYKNSAVVFDENAKLKSQLDEITKIPDSYLNPSDIQLDTNRLSDIQQRAKEAGMNQAQYEKFVRSDKSRVDRNKESFEKAKKDLGEETLNLLTDFVSKTYPKEIADGILNSAIVNKEARQALLNQRDKNLDSRVAGVDKTAAGGAYSVTDDDIKKAYDRKEKSKSMKDIQAYLALVDLKGAQKAS